MRTVPGVTEVGFEKYLHDYTLEEGGLSYSYVLIYKSKFAFWRLGSKPQLMHWIAQMIAQETHFLKTFNVHVRYSKIYF